MLLIKMTSNKPLTAAAADLQAAVQKHGFGVMHIHNLKETMAKKGVAFSAECLIYEVCQPQQAKKVLEQNLSVSTMLPCRISLFEEHGATVLATMKPTALADMFGEPGLRSVAQEVENTLLAIMRDTAAAGR